MQQFDSEGEDGFFRRIAIAGLGLIGGSIAKSLRLRGFQGEIFGYERNPETRLLAEQSGLFNQVAAGPESAEAQVDLLILAVPLGQLEPAMRSLKGLVADGGLITDVGSVKGTVQRIAGQVLQDTGMLFIGGHPMAGSERGGFSASSPILFENAYYFLTPQSPGTPASASAVARMMALVQLLGAIPVVTEPEAHDALAARLSHLPHLTASSLVNVFEGAQNPTELKYAGGGFRDSTRIAMGDPGLWRDIFLHNREQLLQGIDALCAELQQFRTFLTAQDGDAIVSRLQKAQSLRQGLAARRPSEESSLYPLRLDVEDRPGILADVTRLLADSHLNIKDIALDHARENSKGALILSFATHEDRHRAETTIRKAGLGNTMIEQD